MLNTKKRVVRKPSTEKASSTTSGRADDRLETYEAKRRFEVTPEPPPRPRSSQGRGAKEKKPEAGQATLAFVVQKHDARRLHYDVRL
jgi:bifunctional non-homologous end joining protein LigD